MTEVHSLVALLLWTRSKCMELNSWDKVKDLIVHGPHYYYEWWIKLLNENPYHVIVESGLILFIIWLMFIRRTVDPTKETKSKLTQKEIDWLIDTWSPEPLVPEAETIDIPVRMIFVCFNNYWINFL